jgi:tetratricopeptide (TPR) repeat protein
MYVAGSILEDHDTAIRIGEIGRKANPADFTILNDLAYSYAKKGEIEKAKKALSKINTSELIDEQIVVWNATSGLLCYRQGFLDEGRALYLKAIDQSRALKNTKLTALAALFFAMEEMVSAKENFSKSSELALKVSGNLDYPDVKVYLERIGKKRNLG